MRNINEWLKAISEKNAQSQETTNTYAGMGHRNGLYPLKNSRVMSDWGGGSKI